MCINIIAIIRLRDAPLAAPLRVDIGMRVGEASNTIRKSKSGLWGGRGNSYKPRFESPWLPVAGHSHVVRGQKQAICGDLPKWTNNPPKRPALVVDNMQ